MQIGANDGAFFALTWCKADRIDEQQSVEGTMSPKEFQNWRARLRITQAEAALRLGSAKRSIATWESSGPIPRTVELACKALSIEAEADFRLLEQIFREQHPDIGDHVVVLPIAVQRGGTYQKLVDFKFAPEVDEWVRAHAKSAQLLVHTIVTPAMNRREIAAVSFNDANEAFHFKIRWC